MTEAAEREQAQILEAELNEAAIAHLAGAAREGLSPTLIAGNGFSYRHNWGALNGWWILNLHGSVIIPDTRVFVAASEGPTRDGGKFIGAAHYTVHNVAPDNGVVSILLHVDWGSPIGVVVDYLFVTP